MITLSIIIVNYNTKELLERCVDSIKKQVLPARIATSPKSCAYRCWRAQSVAGGSIKYEIIVVDNGSKDGSVEYVKKLENKKYISTIGTIKTIFNKENLGFAKANNQGIKKALGKYTLLLNSDTEFKKGALEKLTKFAEETPDAGVIGPKLLNEDGTVQSSCCHPPTALTAFGEFWLSKQGAFSKYMPYGNKPIEVDAVVGAAFLITPAALKKVGLLDERYFFYFEDLDYCRRVKRAGLKVYYLPEAEIIHLHGASGKKLSGETKRWLVRSSKIYYGWLNYYFVNFIIWSGQKWQKLKELFRLF